MPSFCPSRDWDRHCAMMEGPQPLETSRVVKSKTRHICAACYTPIEAGVQHEMIPQISGDTGLFISPLRVHLKGECIEPDYEDY